MEKIVSFCVSELCPPCKADELKTELKQQADADDRAGDIRGDKGGIMYHLPARGLIILSKARLVIGCPAIPERVVNG